ncbi:MAG: hypothetical protein ACRDVW_10940, partial [Acidimicrobiales bacterium]
VLILDRSILSDVPEREALWEHRGHVASELNNRLGARLDMTITYSDVARSTAVGDLSASFSDGQRSEAVKELSDTFCDMVYGSNLQHALLLARAGCRSFESNRILLITYSLPSAHQGTDKPFFFEPLHPESLEAAKGEADACHVDGLDALVLLGDDDDRSSLLTRYFVDLTGTTDGKAVSTGLSEPPATAVHKFAAASGLRMPE